MAARLTPLAPERFRRTPWKNGGGVTLDIADAWCEGAEVGGWDGMIWRFGRTSIVTPAPFSDLTGFERMQVVIAGDGLVLETPDGEISLRRAFEPVRYDGGTPIVSRLENGPVEVVNLIADRARGAIDLRVMSSGDSLPLPGGEHVAYALDGRAELDCAGSACVVEAGHAVGIAAPGDGALAFLRGDARLVVGSFMPR